VAKGIEMNKTTSKVALEKLIKLQGKKGPIDLDKYFGKVNFEIGGPEYQLKIRE